MSTNCTPFDLVGRCIDLKSEGDDCFPCFECGTPIVFLFRFRQLNVSEVTFYRWRKQFVDIGVAEVRELRMLREENHKLKQLVADLTLDKQILREALGKKV